jgi:hypothetical protein
MNSEMLLGSKRPNQAISCPISMLLSNYCLSVHVRNTTDFSDNLHLTWIVRFFLQLKFMSVVKIIDRLRPPIRVV